MSSVTLVGLREHPSPEDETEAVKLTVPLNPAIEFTLIVDVPICPELTRTEDGVAVRAKSDPADTLTVIVGEDLIRPCEVALRIA